MFFLDEFEFLEPVLLDKIIEESKLDNPFVFIAYFYHNISIKRLDENYLGDHPSIRSQIDEIWKKIDDLKRKSSFPDIRFFGVKDPKVIKSFVGSGLYQSNYTSIDQPIYLEIDQNLQRYWLTGSRSPASPTTFNLMKSIKLITNEILQFYLQLKTDNDKLYAELVEDAYEKTDYIAHLNRLSFFSVMPPRRRNSKRGYRINNFSYLYQRGYVLYVLDKPPTQAEPNEVLLNFFMVNSSPERCLLGLIQKNVVFGLSATATLTRYLEHFNLGWIKEEVNFEADDSILFMEIDEVDKSIINSLSDEKAMKRKNFVELSIANKKCREPFSSIAKKLKEDSKFVSISPNHDYHVERLLLFFNTLDWIVQNPLSERKRETIDSHIVFFNSLRQIRAFMESKKELTPNFKVNSKGKHHYNISYFDQSLCIILLDSKAHKYYFDSSESKSEYNSLFSLSHPTLLITQYPSANNGVNLQYGRKIGTRFIMEDYQSIHLLEAPHFYFSSGSNRSENEIKSDIWKLAQLVLAKKISPIDFNRKIKGIMNNSNDLNKVYKDSTDYTLNQVAKIIQALGRIERVRDRKVGLQRGRISESVLNIFNRYFHNSEIQPVITESLSFFSNFVQLFFSEIRKFTKEKRDKNDIERPSKILIEDKMCKGSLSKLVNSIRQIQDDELFGEAARNFIENWRELRKSALRFDFKSHRIKNCHGTFFSEKIYKNSKISWNPMNGKVCKYDTLDPEEQLLNWDFNLHFRHVKQHGEVRNYFHLQGYELEFIDHLNFQFFTPSFFKQIYLGALGEEATKAIFLSQKSNEGESLFEVVNTEEVNLNLFEIVDFVVPKLNWFVDAKFFSEQNMVQGSITQKVKEASTKKIEKIRSIDPKSKLVLINANSAQTGNISHFDKNFNVAHTKDSDIIVFPSLSQLKELFELWKQ
ncbi:hypothetical protein [Reichenbachiella faecimaris]|uniref:hypothetical protein n=1 Tax=Reichenbachiella faecimaris TaxID=692418 RepID=UPI00111C47D5|nr:hypothetical protein [Reichenbachiella faecimaris]